MLRIAIPIKNDKLVDELSNCENIVIYLVEDDNIVLKESRPFRKVNIETLVRNLQEFRINLLIVSYKNENKRRELNSNKIGVICRNPGDVDEIVKDYVKELRN